eukprot:gene13659-13781_t
MSGRAKRSTAHKKVDAPAETKKVKAGLAKGDDLPEFELQNDEEVTVSSEDLVKDNGIVLFAYPKANTKGCTSQAVGLSEKMEELAAAGYKVYGISADKPKSQANWRKKENLKMNLLCDPSYEVLAKLGFMKGAKGINRSHIVVAKGGKVLDVHYNITPKNSVKDAVAFCLENKGDSLAPAEEKEAGAAEADGEEAAEVGEKAEAMETDEQEKEDKPQEEEKPEEEEKQEEKAAQEEQADEGKEQQAEEPADQAEEQEAEKPAEAAAAEEPAVEDAAATDAAAADDEVAKEDEKPAAEDEVALAGAPYIPACE